MDTAETTSEQKKLGRKYIKGFAGGIAHMFACSAQHYAWLARKHGLSVVTIDLFKLQISPAEFDIERNRILAGMCQRTLSQNIGQLASPDFVTAAVLSVNFGIAEYVPDGGSDVIGRSVFTVLLTDDRGKVWRGEHVERIMRI